MDFVSETFQGVRDGGEFRPLNFEGKVIYMAGFEVKRVPGRPSMGTKFLSKVVRLERVAALQDSGRKFQVLVVNADGCRLIGVYISPSANSKDWVEVLRIFGAVWSCG